MIPAQQGPHFRCRLAFCQLPIRKMNDQTAFSTVALATDSRVALLVDGENISFALAGNILLKGKRFGDLVFRRVYGNAALLNGWNAAPGFRLQHSGTGKNASDLLLCIEAMDLALNRKADVIVLAASDRDYTHLAIYLREAGIRLIGLGEDKTPAAFREACATFIPLAPPSPPAQPAGKPALPPLEQAVRELIRQKADPNGLPISGLNTAIQAKKLVKISLSEPEGLTLFSIICTSALSASLISVLSATEKANTEQTKTRATAKTGT